HRLPGVSVSLSRSTCTEDSLLICSLGNRNYF
uniref:Uncharacterized protein n=1 Tax=Aegilops tauschii subsp. strangulata TaxID=200361 RepID=A0A453LVM4_AEGTS